MPGPGYTGHAGHPSPRSHQRPVVTASGYDDALFIPVSGHAGARGAWLCRTLWHCRTLRLRKTAATSSRAAQAASGQPGNPDNRRTARHPTEARMDTYFFEQPDGTLLQCVGRRLVKTSTERKDGPGSRRWHHLQLLETDDGSLVLAIQYLTLCPGEQPVGYAWRGSPEDLRRIAAGFDAGRHVPGPGNPLPARQHPPNRGRRPARTLRPGPASHSETPVTSRGRYEAGGRREPFSAKGLPSSPRTTPFHLPKTFHGISSQASALSFAPGHTASATRTAPPSAFLKPFT